MRGHAHGRASATRSTRCGPWGPPWVALLGPGGSLPQRGGVHLPIHVQLSLWVRGLLESGD